MDSFTLLVFVGIGVLVAALFLLGRNSSGAPLEQIGLRSAREITSAREELEAEDLQQMLDAHNARRARRGEAAVSVEEIELRWMQEQGAMARERDAARPVTDRTGSSGSRWDALD